MHKYNSMNLKQNLDISTKFKSKDYEELNVNYMKL